jgi:hypothetical protein
MGNRQRPCRKGTNRIQELKLKKSLHQWIKST